MRLLKISDGGEPSLTGDLTEDHEIPRYAILSHTWNQDSDEVTFEDLRDASGKNKAGYDKIRFCGNQAEKDELQYFWVDTCCIRKSSSTELQEAITSMFQWYRKAEKCYVYLADVSTVEHGNARKWKSAFQNSRWFKRGWTLQELLAPKSVEFFSREGDFLGDKRLLEQQIHKATDIPIAALHNARLSDFSVNERMRWAKNRQTKRKEDQAYCLLGVFNVFMYLNYGEGDNAFKRLEAEIGKSSEDHPSESVCHLPFDPIPGFVGRTVELETIAKTLLDPDGRRTVSLLGLGGIGKSRLALELAYRVKSKHPQRSIFWVQASDQSTLERDMLEIGKKLKIPGVEDEKADVKVLVTQRLSLSTTDKWLLILDNADDEALWGRRSNLDQQTLSLVKYLPKTTSGSILITTRTRRVASFLAEKDVIKLDTMMQDEAVDLFVSKLEDGNLAIQRNSLLALVNKLACLPLAIVQAASYVNMTETPIHTYLDLLDQPEAEVVNLLGKDFGDASRYPEAINQVATTWLISFEHIQKQHPLAAEFLSTMACLCEKSIPSSLLPEVDSKIDGIEALAILTGYAFVTKQSGVISVTDGEDLYDLHRLVQLAARNWLKNESTFSEWNNACIRRLARLFPDRDHKFKGLWSMYLPHALRVCDANKNEDSAERYNLLEKIGLCLMIECKYDEAVKIQTAVLNWRESAPNISEEETLEAYNNLGEALDWQGNSSQAEIYLQKAVQGRIAVLGKSHRHTLTSMINLAGSLGNQGKYVEAEKIHREVLQWYEIVLDKRHPETLTCMNNLGEMLRGQGKFVEAEKMHRKTLQLRKLVVGKEHPETLVSMNNLGLALIMQDKCVEAEKIHRDALKLDQKVFGKSHPSTLTSMGNLGLVLGKQNKLAEAEKMHRETFQSREMMLGKHHPDTLISMNNLASTLGRQGQYVKAEKMNREALYLSETVLGKSHPDTLASMHNLAWILMDMGRTKEAVKVMRCCTELSLEALGPAHPRTRISFDALQEWFNRKKRKRKRKTRKRCKDTR